MALFHSKAFAKQRLGQSMEQQQSPKLTLHIWPGKWNLPSIEPSCLAAFLFLQLTAGGQFAVTECVNPDLSPTGG
jgi:sorting and assembly machinery component 37